MADETEIEPYEWNLADSLTNHSKILISGGVAGCVAKTVTAPLSRITILFQVHSMLPAVQAQGASSFAPSLSSAISKVYREEGLRAFWKGNGTSVLHRFPYSGINFFAFERIKRLIGTGKDATDTPLTRMLSGAGAGAIACIACYPLDLVRTRLTTQTRASTMHYSGIQHALARIWMEEGFFGLYRGVGTTLTVSVPNLAISYTTYGTMKQMLLRSSSEREEDISWERMTSITLLCGALSGLVSSLVTFPADVVRRRMQMQGLHHKHAGAVKRGAVAEAQHILRTEGVRGLYRGITPELLKVVPMVGVTFLTYEGMKQWLDAS